MSRISELGPALSQLASDLAGVGDELDKATAEIINALSNQEVPADAQVQLDKLKALSDRLKSSATVLDDLNPDATTAPGSPVAESPVAAAEEPPTAGSGETSGESGSPT